MTAKKYVENATSDRLVVFQRDIFKDFVNQLCKEQRELCWSELNKKVYMDKDATKQLTKIVILNTKQPEV